MNFTGYPPSDKSFGGVQEDTLDRVSRLERRKQFVLPARLQAEGAETTNWNQAIEAGNYWSVPSAINSPFGLTWQGRVDPGPEGRVIQTLTNILNPVSWKRSRKAPNTPTSFNGTPAASSAANPRWAAEWQSRWGWNRGEQAAGGPTGGRFIRWTCPSSQDSSSRGWNAYYNLDFDPTFYVQEANFRKVWAGETVIVRVWVRSSKAASFYMNAAVTDGYSSRPQLPITISPTVAAAANAWVEIVGTFTPTATGYLGIGVYGVSGTTYASGDTIDGALFSVEYTQGEWTPWRRSDNLLVPARCVGGTAGAQVNRVGNFDMQTGRYNLTVGDKYFAMDGVFTDEFRAYEVYAEWATGVSNGGGMRLRQNTAEIGTSSYEFQIMYIVGTGTPAGQQGVGNQGSFPPNSGSGFQVDVKVVNPATTTGNYNQKRFIGQWSSYGTTQAATVNSNLVSYDQQFMDGFSIYNSDQAKAGVVSGAGAFIYVRGLA